LLPSKYLLRAFKLVLENTDRIDHYIKFSGLWLRAEMCKTPCAWAFLSILFFSLFLLISQVLLQVPFAPGYWSLGLIQGTGKKFHQ
jgi:hypothetical protein